MRGFFLYGLLFFFGTVLFAEADSVKPLDLKFTAADGRQVDFSKLRGKVVLIDFWATWCPPCVAGMPDLVAAYKKYHAQGFEIVGISLDQDKAAMFAFTKKEGMVWPQYFDGKGWENEIGQAFGVDEIPAMVLLDRKGLPVHGGGDVAEEVAKLLKEP